MFFMSAEVKPTGDHPSYSVAMEYALLTIKPLVG